MGGSFTAAVLLVPVGPEKEIQVFTVDADGGTFKNDQDRRADVQGPRVRRDQGGGRGRHRGAQHRAMWAAAHRHSDCPEALCIVPRLHTTPTTHLPGALAPHHDPARDGDQAQPALVGGGDGRVDKGGAVGSHGAELGRVHEQSERTVGLALGDLLA